MPAATLTRRAAGVDVLAIVASIIAAWVLSRGALYPWLGVPDNAPVILRPITGFFVAWWLLRVRGSRWRDLGLRWPDRGWLAVIGAAALYGSNTLVLRYVVPILARMLHAAPQPSFIGYVHGNLGGFLLWLAIGCVVGGLFEELLFRGFLIHRIATIFGNGAAAIAIAVVMQALLFGSMHFYAGAFAAAHAALFALVNGVFYLLLGRNLWPLVIVHSIWNSVAIWGVYSG